MTRTAARATPVASGELATIDKASPRRSTWNRLEDHGGPLMLSTVNVYFIWYGQWTSSPAQPILVDLASSIGGSSYFNIVSTYKNGAGVGPLNGVVYSGAVSDDAYSMGATLTRSDIAMIVSQSIASGQLPLDTDAVYVVLPDPTVEASGHCSTWCAFHDTTNVNSLTVQYAFVGNPQRCPSKCAAQVTGPNGDATGDAMALLLAAELVNTTVDPLRNAWFDQNLLEPADKCAWTYGTTYPAQNGALANAQLGGRDYLLQQVWVNQAQPPRTKGSCATSF